MIKAELSYNPYLLETRIKFNEQEPRINSQVEKFIDGPLQKWVKQLPQIFYDEMNGYDFELEFTGPKADFLEVAKAFQEAGVSKEDVRLVHINEIGSRDKKVGLIDELLKWLEECGNERFFDHEDFIEFKDSNYDLFDGFYPYIIVQGSSIDTASLSSTDISPENIINIEELDTTNLVNTPILFFISADNLQEFQSNLQIIRERKDITDEQLFFMLHGSVNADKARRVIQDLGVQQPQIIEDVYSEEVRKYMELYPISDYIYKSIKILRNVSTPLDKDLKERREISNQKNKGINQEIEKLELSIAALKEALSKFENRDMIQMPDTWKQNKVAFLQSIWTWRDRKTKITKDDEAVKVALEFDIYLVNQYRLFLESLMQEVDTAVAAVIYQYKEWYHSGGFDIQYSCIVDGMKKFQNPDMPSIKDKLLEIKEETFVQAREAIFPSFFKNKTEQVADMVLEVTYSYQRWKEFATSVASPIVEKILQDYYDRLVEMGEQMAEDYISHLNTLIEKQTEKKSKTALQLSNDEQLLQEDINWITTFCDKIGKIERG